MDVTGYGTWYCRNVKVLLYLKSYDQIVFVSAIWDALNCHKYVTEQSPSLVQLLSSVWLWDPMDCSTLGYPIHHQLPELAQTPVHWVSDAMQPSHPPSSPSPPAIFPSIRVFSNESALHIGWPKYWSFSFSINPFNEYSGLISFRMDWFDLFAVQGTPRSLLQHQVQKHQFFGAQSSLWSNSHNHT